MTWQSQWGHELLEMLWYDVNCPQHSLIVAVSGLIFCSNEFHGFCCPGKGKVALMEIERWCFWKAFVKKRHGKQPWTQKLVGSFLTLRVSFHVSSVFLSKLWQTRVSHIERFYFLFTTYWFHYMIHRSPNIYSGSSRSTLMIKIGVNMTYTNTHSQ